MNILRIATPITLPFLARRHRQPRRSCHVYDISFFVNICQHIQCIVSLQPHGINISDGPMRMRYIATRCLPLCTTGLWYSVLYHHSSSTLSMSENECTCVAGQRRPHHEDDALQLGPRKKPFVPLSVQRCLTSYLSLSLCSCLTDPLVHHGRHFGRTVHALCSIRTLLQNGVRRITQPETEADLNLTPQYAFFRYPF